MPKRITKDHKMFRDVVSGATRKELQKRIKTGQIFRDRGKNGKISIPIPEIHLPHFAYGSPEEGVGRGEGDIGDVVGKEPGKGKKGDKAGEVTSDGMLVDVDMKFILEALQQELELPNLIKKDSETFEEVKIKYNGISRVGTEALLHKRKTMLQCIKRNAAMGQLENKIIVPGYREAVQIYTPITDDKRYRQWNEIKVPSSNAVIFFARDISGSMTPEKCEIVSDIAWWLDLWIKNFYDKVQRCYVVHDTVAKEVSENRFYKMREGGGTLCSSALTYINKQLKHRFPPEKWNVYIFYFTDGENAFNDNEKFCSILKNEFKPEKVRLFGLTQILAHNYGQMIKDFVDNKITSGELDNQFIRTSEVSNSAQDQSLGWGGYYESMPAEERNAGIKNVLRELLGTHKQDLSPKKAAPVGG